MAHGSTLWFPAIAARPAERGQPLSFDAWLALGEDEPGEWVDGCLQEEEVPDAVHELAVSWLIALLRQWLKGQGFVLGSEAKLAVSATRGRKADVLVFLPGTPPPPRRGPLRHPPDIVIEVVTPTPRDERRDRVEKMDDYATFGVPGYWLVDPALGTFELFSLGPEKRYARAVGRSDGVISDVPDCEGLTIDLGALWAELERLGPEA